MIKKKCPCCGYYTQLVEHEDEPLFEICEVCFWQYDRTAHDRPCVAGGANNISLKDARKNYKQFGVCTPGYERHSREPLEEELPENNKEWFRAEDEIIIEEDVERKKIAIDVRNCKSIDEIQSLLKENLMLPEWDDKKPDELLRLLKELEPYEIYIVGANLLPDTISLYINKTIDILNKMHKMHGNTLVRVMDVVTIDFNRAKYVSQVHDIIKEKLKFPEWYGGNLDALWSLLVRHIEPYEIHLKGIADVPEHLQPFMQKMVEIFQEAEKEYDYHKIIIE